MIKVIATVKRRPEISRDQLFETWEKVHAPNVAKNGKPDLYRVTLFDGVMGGGDPPVDGMATLYYDSFDTFKTALANVPPDPFSDLILGSETSYLYTTETVAVAGPVDRNSAKATFFVKRQDRIDEAAHFAHWRERHLPNVQAAMQRNPGGLRYVVSFADLGRPGAYSGVAELYWTDVAAMRVGLPGREKDGFGEVSEPYSGILGSEITIIG